MRLLLDNNLSPRLAACLHALFQDDHEIVALRAKFPPATIDADWIGRLHEERGWAVLTRDLRLRTRPHERAAMDSAAIVFFFLEGAWKTYSVQETAWRLIRWFPTLAKQADLVQRGRFSLPINAGSKLRPQQD